MKKWYKECPFCWEEIKETAKKCKYCWEFLEWKEKNDSDKKTEEKIVTKNYWFWGKFFRKDLWLNKKWWHRLVKVIWIFSIVAAVFGIWVYLITYPTTYEYVEWVENRLEKTWYSTIAELLHSPKEYINYSCIDFPNWHILSHDEYDNWEWMFCSRNWSKKDLIDIATKTNLDYEDYDDVRWKFIVWSVDDVIRANPELCIVKTENWHKFLRFHGVFWNSACIVKERNKLVIWIYLILLTGLYVLVTSILYYKIIIYIIYWNYKKNNQ